MQKFAIAVVLVISFLLLLTSYGMGAEPDVADDMVEAENWEYKFSTLLRSDGAGSIFAGVHHDWFTLTGSLYADHLIENSLMGWMVHSTAMPRFDQSDFYGGFRGTLGSLGPGPESLLWDIGGRIGVSNILPEEGLAIAYLWLDISLTEDLDVHPMWSGGFIVGKKEFQFGLEIVGGELYDSGSGAFDIWIGLREWTEDDQEGKFSIRVGALQDGGRIWWGRGAIGRSGHGWSAYFLLTVRG